jgi:methyl-accepting chemotaxis protein
MKPINQLNVAIKDISQGDGDLTQRLTVVSQDEIGQLSTATLYQHIEQVRQSAHLGIEMHQQQLSRGSSVSNAITELNQLVGKFKV